MKKNSKAIFAAMVGNALEYYDVMLYGFFAAMLAPLFFPTENETISIISSLGTFAAGFVMRPLGGLVFGHLGDKFGRRHALVLAIFLVTLPTLIIGLLPTYADIGIAAPIILILCRLLQGLCVGGEYSGASIFVVEYSKRGREAFAGSILCAAGVFGGVLGTLIGFLCTLPVMPIWGWRIPFIIGSIFGLIGYYIRTQTNETPVFIEHKNEKIAKIPLWSILLKRKRSLFCTIVAGATALTPLYIASVYMGHVLSAELHLPTSDIMLINIGLNVMIMLSLSFMGYLADRVISKENLMMISCVLLVVVTYPLFVFLKSNLSVQSVLICQAVIVFSYTPFVAPSMAFLSTLFPVHERYSGIGFGYALGCALLGGTAPLIIVSLEKYLQDPMVPAYYLILTSLLGVVCLLLSRKEGQSPTTRVSMPQEFPQAA